MKLWIIHGEGDRSVDHYGIVGKMSPQTFSFGPTVSPVCGFDVLARGYEKKRHRAKICKRCVKKMEEILRARDLHTHSLWEQVHRIASGQHPCDFETIHKNNLERQKRNEKNRKARIARRNRECHG